ncbi:MAG: hypothetical protein L3K18_02300 [Thermoplasmata archaeon]|nr:hypothetical protein [Thermoplasmata archaeon]MCI4355962.1 hypothetical protein [Thermoplasmata archaeon]
MTPALPLWLSIVIVTLIVTLPGAMLGMLVFLLVRLHSRRQLQKGLFQIIFLPEKRTRFLTLLILLATFFLASGAVEGLSSVGFVSTLELQILTPITFLGGALWLFLLIWTSLNPGRLTAAEIATLETAPAEFYSLAFAAMDQSPGGRSA